MNVQKCWLVGTDDLGYLLYWAETRTQARKLGESEMCSGYDEDPPLWMTLRALRVPDLDNLPGDGADDRMFLIAGAWTECLGCHCRISLEPMIDDYGDDVVNRPYLESLTSHLVWCETCARDIDGAFEANRDDLLRSVQMTYGAVPA